MHLFCLKLISLALVLGSALALVDTCKTSYKSSVVDGCKANKPECCGIPASNPPSCAILHTMRGKWVTELDTIRDMDSCTKECNRHLFKCGDKCECLSEVGEVRSSKVCKCVRVFPGAVVQEQCLNACAKAQQKCIKSCMTPTRCPLKATTKVKFSMKYKGTCAGICLRPIPIRPICPVPV